jgi:hypothetical protein
MNAQHITELARAAKRDGLTLTWSLIRVAEMLEQHGMQSEPVDSDASLPAASEDQRLDNEALALVLMAVIAAYPSGADIPSESIPTIQ